MAPWGQELAQNFDSVPSRQHRSQDSSQTCSLNLKFPPHGNRPEVNAPAMGAAWIDLR